MTNPRPSTAFRSAILAAAVLAALGCRPMLYPAARMFGSPAESELAACRANLRRLQSELPQGSLVVHPPCVFSRGGMRWERSLAPGVIEALAADGFNPVPFDGPDPNLDPAGPGANQMRFTWKRARDYSKWTAEHKPAGAWHLFADLIVDGGGTIHGMELYIVDGQGKLALVRLVNSHQPAFQGIQPGSLPSGCGVLVKVIQRTLKLTPEQVYPPYGVG